VAMNWYIDFVLLKTSLMDFYTIIFCIPPKTKQQFYFVKNATIKQIPKRKNIQNYLFISIYLHLSTQTAQTNELADTIIIFKEKERERERVLHVLDTINTISRHSTCHTHACDISK
tara:strand:+ start:49 stop:396 length:348 start_codon:yes stop_codon:yes gene_type:complete